MINMHSLTKMLTIRKVFMKKRIVITIVLLLIACLVIGLAACDNNGLAAPSDLEMSGNVLTWQAVDGAEGYEVVIDNGEPVKTKEAMYFVEVGATGTYEIRVRAFKGDKYSEYSETYSYVVLELLDKPVVSYDELTKVVSWNAVEGASAYAVRVRYTDKDISADGAIIELSEVSATTYTLSKEEYGKPGSFTIEVRAIAPENSGKSDSAYSDACVFVNSATLSTPVLSSITSTRVYWNSVANATSYYLEARNKANADEVYSTTVNASTSTSVSVLLTNFNIRTPGEYTVHIKTIGDGKVYNDSAISDVNEDFVIYKLPELDEGSLILVENGDGTVSASWTATDKQLELIESFTLVMTPYDSDGNALLSAQRVTFNLESESDMQKLTVTEGEGKTTYSYVIDTTFRKVGDDNVTEYILNNAYYGKRYTVEVSSTRSGNGVIAGTAVKAADKYLSYKTPQKDDGGNYLISSAAELAYIYKQPDASYKQIANIDFEDYEWVSVQSFGGKYDGAEFIIYDLSIISDDANAGFFGEIKSGATVTNLKLVNAIVESDTASYAGIIAGINGGTVSDSVVTGGANAKFATAGGAVGLNNGTVTTSQSVADVTAAIAGGLVGKNATGATVSYSTVKGNVTASASAPEEGETEIKESYAGGFIAYNEGTVVGSNSVGNVAGNSSVALDNPNYAGGFVGYNTGNITLSYAGANYSNDYAKRNTVSSAGRNENIAVGGFVGYNAGSIENSYANVKATSPKYVGGFVGFNADGASITNAYSIGGVTVNTNNVGGFSGNTSGTIDNVYYYDETLGDAANRADKELSTYVALSDIGQTLATNLGDAYGVIGGEHPIRNAVLKNNLYVSNDELTVSPGAEIKSVARYVAADGTVKEITATNKVAEGETTSGYMICGNQTTEGTVIIVFSSGSYRGVAVVTID